jgi:hypothetical protein
MRPSDPEAQRLGHHLRPPSLMPGILTDPNDTKAIMTCFISQDDHQGETDLNADSYNALVLLNPVVHRKSLRALFPCYGWLFA